jgi:hypothetical protein
MFPEVIRIRGERGLSTAMGKAASRERTSAAEWARRKLRAALIADGVALPPFADEENGDSGPMASNGVAY